FGRPWVAESTFAPQSASGTSGQLAALASQFGVAIPGVQAEEASIDFYLRLARSRVLLEQVALHAHAFPLEPEGSDSARGTLLSLYEVGEGRPSDRLGAAVARLREDIEVEGDLTAGVVTLTTQAPWAGLAVQLNRQL